MVASCLGTLEFCEWSNELPKHSASTHSMPHAGLGIPIGLMSDLTVGVPAGGGRVRQIASPSSRVRQYSGKDGATVSAYVGTLGCIIKFFSKDSECCQDPKD